MLMAALGRHQVVAAHPVGGTSPPPLPTWHRNARRAPEPTIPGPSDNRDRPFALTSRREGVPFDISDIHLHLHLRLRLSSGRRAVWVEMN